MWGIPGAHSIIFEHDCSSLIRLNFGQNNSTWSKIEVTLSRYSLLRTHYLQFARQQILQNAPGLFEWNFDYRTQESQDNRQAMVKRLRISPASRRRTTSC